MAMLFLLQTGVVLVLAATVVHGQCTSIPQCECNNWTHTLTCPNVGSTLAQILPSISSSIKNLEITGASMFSLRQQDFDKMPSSEIINLRIIHGQAQEISDSAFKKFPILRKLSVTHNQISSITGQAFMGIGSLLNLDLSHNRLSSFSSTDMFKTVIYLRDIDLSNNQLTDIPDGLLDPLKSLHTLNLNGNRISTLRGSAFQSTIGIRNLHISQNGLTTIDDQFFTKVTMLDTLDLSYNRLTVVPGNGNLNLLGHLRNLTLQGNLITDLPGGTFRGMNLDILDLSKNGIASLSADTFMYLGSVRQLDLSNNKLATLPDTVFQPIASQLFSLKLDYNGGITIVPDNLFTGMQMLQDLSLSNCAISRIYDGQFAFIFSLQKIDISNNLLQTLPESFLSKANQITEVRISNNPWVCDCSIKPLRDWLRLPRSSSVLFCSDSNEIPGAFSRNCASQKCSSPQKLLYRDINTLQDQEIPPCERFAESTSASMEVIIGVIAGVIVCAIVIIILLICAYRRHKKGEPLLCGNSEKTRKKKRRKEPKNDIFREKKEKRPHIDPEIGSQNESDKGFVVRNYFHSMMPDTDDASVATQSMTRRGSQESLSHSGYAYGSQAGSRTSSQYSLNSGYRIESAV